MDGNPLFSEIVSITGASPGVKRFTIPNAVVKVPDGNFYIDRISTVRISADYVNSITDRVNILIMIPLYDLIVHIIPNRDNIKVVLDINRLGGDLVGEFKANLDMSMKEGRGIYSKANPGDIPKTFVEVQMELIDNNILRKRELTVDGIFKDHTVSDILLDNFGIPGGIKLINKLSGGFFMTPSDNSRVYSNIIVPTGTKVLHLPAYLQEKYGVYNGGINLYKKAFTDDNLKIFPLHRANGLKHFKNILKVISMPDSMLKSVDSTYVMDDSILKVVTFDAMKIKDDDRDVASKGVKVLAVESETLLKRQFEITPTSLKLDGDRFTSKTAHREIPGSSTVVDGGVTSNFYKLRSSVLASDGYYVPIEWKYSNSFLLTPLMSVILMTVDDEGIPVQTEGLLHQYTAIIDKNTESEVTSLLVFVKAESKSDSSLSKLTKIF